MKNFFLTSLFLIKISFSFAQKHDNVWIHIYPNGLNPPYPAASLNFATSPPILDFSPTVFPGNESLIIMSDYEGTPLFYSNGHNIYNVNGLVMANGDSLLPIIFQMNYPLGYPYPLTMMGLPRPAQAHTMFA